MSKHPDIETAIETAIETRGLHKRYGSVVALAGLDLAVPRGSLFGLLGLNGAGKSTFINILAGLAVQTSGVARVWGYDVREQRRAVNSALGVVPQEVNTDMFFSPRESLELHAGLYGVPRAKRRTQKILKLLFLEDKADEYSRNLSGGMRRRLMVGKALVHRPPVLILDEPTAGVDVELRHQLWTYVRELHAAGTTIVLTTHYLEEAQSLCERIAILDKGRLLVCEDTDSLLRRVGRRTMRIIFSKPLKVVPPIRGDFECQLDRDGALLVWFDTRVKSGDILSAFSEAGHIADVVVRDSSLEDVFLRIVPLDEQREVSSHKGGARSSVG